MIIMKNQRGLSFFGLLIILGLIAFFALVGMKILPLYMENASVNSTLDYLVGEPEMGKRGIRGMKKAIDGNFDVNDVKTITSKDITYIKSKKKKVWLVSADYEARTILFKNVGVFIEFKKTVEVPR